MSYTDFVNGDSYKEMEELSKSLFGKDCNNDDEDISNTEINNTFVKLDDINKSISISPDNHDDLIAHNGRLFIAVELVGKALFTNKFIITRDQLAKYICEATQKTNYNCNDKCKAMCDGGNCLCAYCLTIAEHILQNKK